MARTQKLPRLTFIITPSVNGYIVGCSQIPYLFTDIVSVEKIDQIVRILVSEYVENFPDDAQKRGIDKNISIQTVWRGSPNSVALE
jgi:hypothetical protein